MSFFSRSFFFFFLFFVHLFLCDNRSINNVSLRLNPSSSTSAKQVANSKVLQDSSVSDTINNKDQPDLSGDNANGNHIISTGIVKRKSLNDVELMRSNLVVDSSLKQDMRYV